MESYGVYSADILRNHGSSRLCCRVSFPGTGHHSTEPQCGCDHRGDTVELHQHPQYRFSAPGCHTGDSVYPDWWNSDASHDEYARTRNVSPLKFIVISSDSFLSNL